MRKTSQSTPEDQNIQFYESAFGVVLRVAGWSIVALLVALLLTIGWQAYPSIAENGLGFYTGTKWDPVFKTYSAAPFVVGTLVTTVLSLLIAIPISISLALYMGFYLKDGPLSTFVRTVIDLLASIPSVIYGFWGLAVLVPFIRNIELAIGIIPYGVGILTAALILAVMIVPYAASIGRDVISMVPNDLKEAGLALGATPLEVVTNVVLPYAKSGIMSGILLSFWACHRRDNGRDDGDWKCQ